MSRSLKRFSSSPPRPLPQCRARGGFYGGIGVRTVRPGRLQRVPVQLRANWLWQDPHYAGKRGRANARDDPPRYGAGGWGVCVHGVARTYSLFCPRSPALAGSAFGRPGFEQQALALIKSLLTDQTVLTLLPVQVTVFVYSRVGAFKRICHSLPSPPH